MNIRLPLVLPFDLGVRDGEVTIGLCPGCPAGRYDGKPLAQLTLFSPQALRALE